MSSDLSFMNRLTSEHKNPQRVSKAVPVAPENNEGMPSTELNTIIVTATKKCDYGCGKTGIPILPVVLSKIDYKVTPQDERYFPHNIASIPSSHTAVASLPSHAYLYCYIEYSEGYYFEEYYTGADGALKRTNSYIYENFEERASGSGQIAVQNIDESDSDTSEEDVQPFTCNKKEHSTLDSKYITLFQGNTAWLMVSHAKLSKSALKRYVDDETLRNRRMQKFIVDELTGNTNTINMSTNEVSYIKSFSQRKQLAQDGDITNKIDVKEKKGKDDILGGTRAALSLYQSMQRSVSEMIEGTEGIISIGNGTESDEEELKFLKKVKPMMVALPDPVGEVIAAAEKRNYLLKKLDDAQKNKGKIREQVNAIIIDNIKSSIEANNQSSVHEQHGYSRVGLSRYRKAESAVGRNIYEYINESKFKAVLESAKKDRAIKQELVKARQEFVKAINHPDFAYIMREDFIEGDLVCDLGYAQIIADAIPGLGIDESNLGIPDAIWADYEPEQSEGMTARQEFEQTMLPCLSGEKPLEDNWLIKALIGLNAGDNQKMQDAPAYENLARASDFIGAAASWLNTIKTIEQQKAIDANVAKKIQRLDELASYKSRVIQTMSNNMSHIKEKNPLLFKADLFTQAAVKQSTGLQLARRTLKLAPNIITDKLGAFLKSRIDKAKPYKTIIPAAIDEAAVKSASGSSAPFAVEYIPPQYVDQQALDIYNKAAAGDKHARMVVTLYTDKVTADAAASANQSLADAQMDLDKYVDSHSGAQRQLERSSAGKAALISAGIGLFQLRSVWMGKSNLSAMANRGDSVAREFMTSYTSTSFALMGAALDVAAAGMQIRGASAAAMARLSLSVGVLGAVGAGFEVYSLSISLERQLESRSQSSAIGTGVAMISAGAAGIAGIAIGLGFVMPWVIGIMAVAWAVSLIAQWVAFTYDKSHILPIHYWLDAGVFGNKAMLNSEYPNNPFKIQAMGSIEQDMHAYSLALTEIQVNPKFATNIANFRQTLSGQIEVTLSQWNDDSELVVEFISIGSQELGLDRKSFSIETLKRQNKAIETSKGVQVVLDIPKTSHFQAQYLGSHKDGTLNPNKERDMQEAREIAQANAGHEVDKLRAVVKYALNPSVNPYYQLRTSVTSQ